jgi:hypothetical protein
LVAPASVAGPNFFCSLVEPPPGKRFGGVQSPRSLEPERLPPPPEMPSHSIGVTLGIMVAIIFVATMAYYFAVGGGLRPSHFFLS